MKIHDLALDDRPREKLAAHGSTTLSDAELLAIVLATSGVPGRSVLELAREILKKFGSLSELAVVDRRQFRDFRGVGDAKSILLAAVAEIGRRTATAKLSNRKQVFDSPEIIAQKFRSKIADSKRENFFVLGFDAHQKMIFDERIATGNFSAVEIDQRDIFAPALLEKARSVVLLHNHPSGDLRPSPADREVTSRAVEGGRSLGITVLDHIIVGNTGYHSFAEAGEI